MNRRTLQPIINVALVVCVIIMVAMVVRREVITRESLEGGSPVPVAGWEALADEGHILGPADAPVRVVVFSDFSCPACSSLYVDLRRLRAQYSDHLAVVYRHAPAPAVRPLGLEAALASECAAAQGRFSRFHDVLYENVELLGIRRWKHFAEDAGLPDTADFVRCLEAREFIPVIERDIEAARSVALRGTPTLIISGEMVTGALSHRELNAMIEAALDEQS